jgi:phosphate transport system substrate-binding protein
MTTTLWRAAIFAALVCSTGVAAQDVTLTARDGALSIAGTLQIFDGEFFRILSPYGLLTLDAEGVVCDGPACPDLTAPRANIHILGTAEAGQALLPPLFLAFAAHQGLTFVPATDAAAAQLLDPETGQILAEMSFAAATPDQARAALLAGQAEMVLAQQSAPDLTAHALAMDALVPIVARSNPMPRIASTALAKALAGEVTNWSEVGGPDMPLILHALAADSDLGQALAARIGKPVVGQNTHASLAELAAAVAADPWALAVTGRSNIGSARQLDLTDSCGFRLQADRLAVKSEDYPLTLPVFLLTPPRRLPLIAREFLDFLDTPAAQSVILAAGYIDRSEERRAMDLDGSRWLSAIKGADKDTTIADLQKLALVMDGAERSSLTFRFEDGSNTLDAQGQSNLATLAKLIDIKAFQGKRLIFASFSDGSGSPKSNRALAADRLDVVLRGLRMAIPNLAEADLLEGFAFGEILPIACDETGAGRRLNRRVELWVKPMFVIDTPLTEN